MHSDYLIGIDAEAAPSSESRFWKDFLLPFVGVTAVLVSVVVVYETHKFNKSGQSRSSSNKWSSWSSPHAKRKYTL